MPHEKIDHGPNRPSLRLTWDSEPYPASAFITASAPLGPSWTMSRDGRVSVALDTDDIDKLIAALRRAKRKIAQQVGTIGITVKPDTAKFKADAQAALDARG